MKFTSTFRKCLTVMLAVAGLSAVVKAQESTMLVFDPSGGGRFFVSDNTSRTEYTGQADKWSWDASTNTLFLKGMSWTTTAASALIIRGWGMASFTIDYSGVNTFEALATSAQDLTPYVGVQGQGSEFILKSSSGGTFNAKADGSSSSLDYTGLSVIGNLTIESGNVNVVAVAPGHKGEYVYGVNVDGVLTIAGGNIDVTVGESTGGSYALSVSSPNKLAIHGGNVKAIADVSDEPDGSYGILGRTEIELLGGDVEAKGATAAIFSNTPILPTEYNWTNTEGNQLVSSSTPFSQSPYAKLQLPPYIDGSVNRTSDADATLTFKADRGTSYKYWVKSTSNQAPDQWNDHSVFTDGNSLSKGVVTSPDGAADFDVWVSVYDSNSGLHGSKRISVPAMSENSIAGVTQSFFGYGITLHKISTSTFPIYTGGNGLPVTYRYSSDNGANWTDDPQGTAILPVGNNKIEITQPAGHSMNGKTIEVQLTINKAMLTLMADDKSMTAGDALPAFTYTVSGLVSPDVAADVIGVEPTLSCSTDGKTAGTFDVNITGGSLKTDGAALNYELSLVKGTLTVNAGTTPQPEPEPQPETTPDYLRMIVPEAEGVTTNPEAGEHQVKYGDDFSISFTAEEGYSLHGMKLFANNMELPITISEDGKTATATIEMPLADMLFRIELVETTTSTRLPPTTSQGVGDLIVSTTAGGITVSGLHVGTMLYIYNMTGQLVYSQRVDVETRLIASLPTGAYIIVNDNRRVKAVR